MTKRKIVTAIEEASKKLDQARWANSEEGQAVLIAEKTKKENAEKRKEFAIGQLVWSVEIMDDPTNMITGGKIVNRANKIVAINEDQVCVEMLFIKYDDVKEEYYRDFLSYMHTKGEPDQYPFSLLEKHVAKNGNVWWKVK